MPIWFVLTLAFALAVGVAWVVVVGWLDEERRARTLGCPPCAPHRAPGPRDPFEDPPA